MKLRIIIAFLMGIGIIGARVEAQDEEHLKHQLLHAHLELAALDHYRKVEGVAYDLSPRIRWNFLGWTNGIVAAEKPSPDWQFQVGKVFQISHDGILFKQYKSPDITMEGDYKLVFIRNFPKSYGVVDDSTFCFYALPSTPYSYTSTQGATKTVAAYDYGTTPSKDEIAKLKVEDAARLKAEQDERDRQWQIALQNKQDRIEEARQLQLQQEKLKKQRQEDTKRKIFQFYQSQATNGDAYTQFRLGGFYLHGEGVETNVTLARLWLSTALTNGYPQATNLLNEIESKAP